MAELASKQQQSAGVRAERDSLVELLQRAHAGELAAFRAYDGHWRAVREPSEREHIKRIAEEELDHRARVHAILTAVGAKPAAWRELVFGLIGAFISIACRFGALFGGVGWYAAMDGAGRLEAGNVHEYAHAAAHARGAGAAEHVPELMEMAMVEWEHEVYFHDRCQSHWLYRFAPKWSRPDKPVELGAGAPEGDPSP